MNFNFQSVKKVTKNLSLAALLVVFGSAALRAQEPNAGSTTSSSNECEVVFGTDEFKGIELTAAQSSAIDQVSEQWVEQTENVMTPEQISAQDAVIEEYEAAYLAILTPEQQAQEEAGTLDYDTLSSEQEAAIDALDAQYFENTADWELSTEQIAQIEQSEEAYDAAVLEVLTPEQREQYAQNKLYLVFPELMGVTISQEQRQQFTQLGEQVEQKIEAQLAQGLFGGDMDDSELSQLEEQYKGQVLSLLDDEQKQQVEENWEKQNSLEDQCWND
ncbi:MAG: hypothetical protein AAF171_15685 [Cyanobacteria bacterium P01_A01_bin.116]